MFLWQYRTAPFFLLWNPHTQEHIMFWAAAVNENNHFRYVSFRLEKRMKGEMPIFFATVGCWGLGNHYAAAAAYVQQLFPCVFVLMEKLKDECVRSACGRFFMECHGNNIHRQLLLNKRMTYNFSFVFIQKTTMRNSYYINVSTAMTLCANWQILYFIVFIRCAHTISCVHILIAREFMHFHSFYAYSA